MIYGNNKPLAAVLLVLGRYDDSSFCDNVNYENVGVMWSMDAASYSLSTISVCKSTAIRCRPHTTVTVNVMLLLLLFSAIAQRLYLYVRANAATLGWQILCVIHYKLLHECCKWVSHPVKRCLGTSRIEPENTQRLQTSAKPKNNLYIRKKLIYLHMTASLLTLGENKSKFTCHSTEGWWLVNHVKGQSHQYKTVLTRQITVLNIM